MEKETVAGTGEISHHEKNDLRDPKSFSDHADSPQGRRQSAAGNIIHNPLQVSSSSHET